MENFKNKQNRITIIGMIVTISLYVINSFVIDALWRSHINSFVYPLVLVMLLIVFGGIVGYKTKRQVTKKSFVAIYITLILPVICTPAAYFLGIPLVEKYILSFACLTSYLINDAIPTLLGISIDDAENIAKLSVIAFLVIMIAVPPLIYRFTKSADTK